MEIYPVDKLWLHTYVLEPYLQGCSRVMLAWSPESCILGKGPSNLTDRVICWLQGTLLMIPLINTIVWLFWKAFGSPEDLADPFCPELDTTLPPVQGPVVRTHVPSPAEGTTESFNYMETINGERSFSVWKIQKSPTLTVVTQTAANLSSSSTYSANGELRELNYQSGSQKINFCKTSENQILVEMLNETQKMSEKILTLAEPLPWIQQNMIGLKPFVLSVENELMFYLVIPAHSTILPKYFPFLVKSPPYLMKIRAIKTGNEQVSPFGELLKVKLSSTEGFPYNRWHSELWFDPTTGALKKFVEQGFLTCHQTGELMS